MSSNIELEYLAHRTGVLGLETQDISLHGIYKQAPGPVTPWEGGAGEE